MVAVTRPLPWGQGAETQERAGGCNSGAQPIDEGRTAGGSGPCHDLLHAPGGEEAAEAVPPKARHVDGPVTATLDDLVLAGPAVGGQTRRDQMARAGCGALRGGRPGRGRRAPLDGPSGCCRGERIRASPGVRNRPDPARPRARGGALPAPPAGTTLVCLAARCAGPPVVRGGTGFCLPTGGLLEFAWLAVPARRRAFKHRRARRRRWPQCGLLSQPPEHGVGRVDHGGRWRACGAVPADSWGSPKDGRQVQRFCCSGVGRLILRPAGPIHCAPP